MTTIQTNRQQEISEPFIWWPWLIPVLTVFMALWGKPFFEALLPYSSVAGEKLTWYLTRSSGVVAYFLLAFSTMWGILLSSKLLNKLVPPAVSLALHNYLSWSSIGLVAFHALILLSDRYYSYQLSDLFIPFTGPYRPFEVGLGIIGLYLMLLTTLTFYLRKQIGMKWWRKIHYLTFGVFGLATVHGLMSGTDALQLGSMYLVSGLGVFFLTMYRILAAASTK